MPFVVRLTGGAAGGVWHLLHTESHWWTFVSSLFGNVWLPSVPEGLSASLLLIDCVGSASPQARIHHVFCHSWWVMFSF
jgi:hypothetical protein